MNTLVTDAIGMTGTLLVVAAYYLMQLEQVQPRGLTYNLMNLIGAILLLISLSYTFNLASFLIEIFWIGAALLGLWKLYRSRYS